MANMAMSTISSAVSITAMVFSGGASAGASTAQKEGVEAASKKLGD